jgi:hypothetical protein
MKIRDLLHTQPAELGSAHGAGHVITGPIVHLHNERTTARARLNLVWKKKNFHNNNLIST